MTDHTNAELIAASETWTPAEVHASPVGAARIIESLAAALETAEQRAKEAERELQVAEDQANNLAGDLAQAERERDEARKAAEDHVLDADAVHVRLSAELRAAEKRAEEAERLAEVRRETIREYERENEAWSVRAHTAERERNALAAVVEKADDFVTRHYLDTRFGDEVLPILTTAPADALRELKADVWAEGFSHCFDSEYADGGASLLDNPYRKEQSGV